MNRVTEAARAGGRQGLRVLGLFALIAASGVVIGLLAAYPLRFIDFEASSAVRLDQTGLAGTIDPQAALATVDDLPAGWQLGDPALAGFGVLGGEFCGTQVDLPTALSDARSVVFSNPTDRTTLIVQALRADRWQSAREYVADVGDATASCDEFFRVGFGAREQVLVREPQGDALITDSVGAAFLSADGRSVAEWSVMAVGDVVIAITFAGSTRPPAPFIGDLELAILSRLVPAQFAPDGVGTATTLPSATTVPGGDVETGPSEGDPGAPVTEPPEDEPTTTAAPTTTAPATTAPTTTRPRAGN